MSEIQVKDKLITLEELGTAYNNITPANIGAVPTGLTTIADCDDNTLHGNGGQIHFYKTSDTTLNTPFKQGLTTSADGLLVVLGNANYTTQIHYQSADTKYYIRSKGGSGSTWNGKAWTENLNKNEAVFYTNTAIDLTKANNNLTTDIWMQPVQWVDKNNKIIAAMQGVTKSNGLTGLYLGVRNYNTDGNVATNKGIWLTADKNNNLTYSFPDAQNALAALGAVAKSGGTMTGDLHRKLSNVDASKSNNNITSTIWPTTYNILDSGNRILSRLESIVNPNGSISAYWYISNYNTSGQHLGNNGIMLTMDKAGNLAYTFSQPEKARTALGITPANIGAVKDGGEVTTADLNENSIRYLGSDSSGSGVGYGTLFTMKNTSGDRRSQLFIQSSDPSAPIKVRAYQNSWQPWHTVYTDSTVVPVTAGGTGATKAADALTNLGFIRLQLDNQSFVNGVSDYEFGKDVQIISVNQIAGSVSISFGNISGWHKWRFNLGSSLTTSYNLMVVYMTI